MNLFSRRDTLFIGTMPLITGRRMPISCRLKWFVLILFGCLSTQGAMGQAYTGTWYSSTDRKFIVDGNAVTNFTDTLWFFCCCWNLTSSQVRDDTSRAIINSQFTASPWGGSASGTYNGTFVSDNLCTGMYTSIKLSGTCAGSAVTNTWTASRTPVMAQTPVPTNLSINVPTNQTISWAAANGATGYRVYFGTTPSPGLVSSQTNTSFIPAGMSINTTFYWRVDTTNAIGTTTGTVWQFTTTNGVSATLDINPSSTNVSSAAASGCAIGVVANVAWTASTNAAWLAVTGGSSGTSNGTVTFSVATNAGTIARTGGVMVAGGGISRTCTVIQAGAAVQRIIGVSGNLAFGNVVTGQTPTATMTINNSGNATLSVTGIGYPTGFTGAWSGSILAGKSTNVTVTFIPLLVQAYGGTVTITNDSTSGTGTISISGTGVSGRPQAQADDNFGVISNLFGFNINWLSGRVVVVDACTNLISPAWIPLQTNTLSNAPSYFSDSKWTNLIGRFYRIRAP